MGENDEHLQCNKCEETFTEKLKLNHHMKTIHLPDHQCSICNISFKRKQSLIKHRKSYHEGLFTPCDICEKPVKDLGYHKRSVHQKIMHSCATCNKTYTSKVMKINLFSFIIKAQESIYTEDREQYREDVSAAQGGVLQHVQKY